MVPVTQEEFDAAHKWSAGEIIQLMRDLDENLLIADLARDESIFELAPELEYHVNGNQVFFQNIFNPLPLITVKCNVRDILQSL